MNNNTTLLAWILLGDFGLLTAVPKYLFLVLLPVMIFLGILGQILTKIPFFKRNSPLVNQFFYAFIGLGCTTAALAALDFIKDGPARSRMIWILVLLIPCSSQLAITAAFASMVTLRVFAVYLAFCLLFMSLLYAAISRAFPLSDHLLRPSETGASFGIKALLSLIGSAFRSILETAPSFCIGSIIISFLMYYGFMDWLCTVFGPFADHFLHLPPEAATLFILNVFKRDFGSASLLSIGSKGTFDAVQMIVLLMMMTFAVPCFNSAILLIKRQKLPEAFVIWLGSLFVSVLIGKFVSIVLLICIV